MKHKDLNDLGEKFLKTGYRFKYKCQVIVKELKSSSNEIPDVIGFYSGGSVIIESKTSKADFNRDKKKIIEIWVQVTTDFFYVKKICYL